MTVQGQSAAPPLLRRELSRFMTETEVLDFGEQFEPPVSFRIRLSRRQTTLHQLRLQFLDGLVDAGRLAVRPLHEFGNAQYLLEVTKRFTACIWKQIQIVLRYDMPPRRVLYPRSFPMADRGADLAMLTPARRDISPQRRQVISHVGAYLARIGRFRRGARCDMHICLGCENVGVVALSGLAGFAARSARRSAVFVQVITDRWGKTKEIIELSWYAEV